MDKWNAPPGRRSSWGEGFECDLSSPQRQCHQRQFEAAESMANGKGILESLRLKKPRVFRMNPKFKVHMRSFNKYIDFVHTPSSVRDEAPNDSKNAPGSLSAGRIRFNSGEVG